MHAPPMGAPPSRGCTPSYQVHALLLGARPPCGCTPSLWVHAFLECTPFLWVHALLRGAHPSQRCTPGIFQRGIHPSQEVHTSRKGICLCKGCTFRVYAFLQSVHPSEVYNLSKGVHRSSHPSRSCTPFTALFSRGVPTNALLVFAFQ